jgi:hypothetical protein
MSGLQDLPLDLGRRGSLKYKHERNHGMNMMLNTLVLLFIATGLGLGVGHFLGNNYNKLNIVYTFIPW